MRSFIFSACLLSFNTFFISLQRMQCPLKSLKKTTKQNKTKQNKSKTHSLFTFRSRTKTFTLFLNRDRIRKDNLCKRKTAISFIHLLFLFHPVISSLVKQKSSAVPVCHPIL